MLKRAIWLGALAGLLTATSTPNPAPAKPQAPVTAILLGGQRIMRSSPAVADFNGDGMKEIVIGTYDGRLIVVSWTGAQWQKVWERQIALDINAANPPIPQTQSRIESPIVVADLDQDGNLEIVVTAGGLPAHGINGGALVYRYQSPWQFALFGNWPQPRLDEVGGGPTWGSPDGYWDGIFSGAAVGDIDGDGDLEIAWEGEDRRIHAYHHNGTVVASWPFHRAQGDPLARGGISSPALGDIDGDGLLEIVVGGTSPRCSWWGTDPCGQIDYSVAPVWAINGDSSLVPGWPKYVPQLVDSSPALGDLDGDGHLDIVVGTGRNQIPGGDGSFIYAWRGNGVALPGWPQPIIKWAQGSPALADLNGDSNLDVTIGCGHMDDSDCYTLYAWQGSGSVMSSFPVQPPTTHLSPLLLSTALSPIVADIDGDSLLDILLTGHNSPGVTVMRANGTAHADMSRNQVAPLNGLYAPALVADIDNDGLLETIAVGEANGQAALYIWEEIGAATLSAMPWPMDRHDNRRTGNYCFTEALPSNPTAFSTSVPTNTWTSQSTITVWWAGASVGGLCPGVPSYSVVWSNSPTTIPDTIVDTAFTSHTTPNLSDGVWWFHLRTRDSWSNWASGVTHVGPFLVDKTPPTLPFASFTSPSINTWSGNSHITVTLSPSIDSGSGLGGYSIVWDQSPSTLPDTMLDVGPVSVLTFGPLSGAGTWYLHVRSVDQVGNWSPDAAHFGPFRIDRIPPTLPNVTSASPTPHIWTSATTLQVQLAAGSDVGSGLNGYSFVWDTQPSTIPDATPDSSVVSSLSTSTTPAVADWYLHVRSVDNVGNASTNTLHYGPFKVDRVPPGAPSVSSASPPSMTWSNVSVITVNLTPAVDPGSGLSGYSVVWDNAPFTTPDTTQEVGNVSAISVSTTANTVATWYLHLRSLDMVGNAASNVMHYGPFKIDRVRPSAALAAPETLNGTTIPIVWWGEDEGSGIASYNVQARLSPSGTWTTWLSNTPSTTLSGSYAPAAPQCGQTYAFRVHAQDAAGNTQLNWSQPVSTLLISSHSITSVVVNNLGQPVLGAQIHSPSACAALRSNAFGRGYAYFNLPNSHTVTVTHPSFSSLPPLMGRTSNDKAVLVVLPPQDNVVINSHFESGAQWAFFGNAGYSDVAHSGMRGAAITGTGVISQQVVIPTRGVLSVLARVENHSPGDAASIRIQLDTPLLPLQHHETAFNLLDTVSLANSFAYNQEVLEDWRHVKLDLSAAGGLPVAIVIEAVDVDPPGLRVFVDEVTLGSTAGGARYLYLPSVRR